MSKDMQFHEAANIFPMMSDEEAIGLLDDIRENGLQKPIETFEGKILDGRNRYLACLKLGEDFDYEYIELDDSIDDPVAYVLSANLHRRHLSESQRSMVGAKAEKAGKKYKKAAKERQGKRTDLGQDDIPANCPGSSGDSRDAVGAAVGVSGKSIDRAAKVINQGVPALVEAVDSGSIPVSRAAEIADLPKAQQPKAITKAKQPKPKSKYPHSDQFHYWLSGITAQMTVMHQRHETVEAMVEDAKWDKKETKEIAVRLRDVLKTLSQYEKDFRSYVNK